MSNLKDKLVNNKKKIGGIVMVSIVLLAAVVIVLPGGESGILTQDEDRELVDYTVQYELELAYNYDQDSVSVNAEGVEVESYTSEGEFVDSDVSDTDGSLTVQEGDYYEVNGHQYSDVDSNTIQINAVAEENDVNPVSVMLSENSDGYYEVSNASELQAIQLDIVHQGSILADDTVNDYVLTEDINMNHTSDASEWGNNHGFVPLGIDRTGASYDGPTAMFDGELDGQDYSINNFESSEFGLLQINEGYVHSLQLENAVVDESKGTVAEMNRGENALIESITLSGDLTYTQSEPESRDNRVGSVVGINRDGATISNSESNLNVESELSAGGLVGYNDASYIEDSEFEGIIQSERDVGGISHTNSGKIESVEVSAEIRGDGDIAGVTVDNREAITRENVDGRTGIVTGANVEDVSLDATEGNLGGVVAINRDNSEITQSTFDGSLTGEFSDEERSPDGVGGIVGANREGYVHQVSADVEMDLYSGEYAVGGVVGVNAPNGDEKQTAIVEEASATVDISAETTEVGGIVGINTVSGGVYDSSVEGIVVGESFVGGVAGANSTDLVEQDGELETAPPEETIENVYTATQVNVTESWSGSHHVMDAEPETYDNIYYDSTIEQPYKEELPPNYETANVGTGLETSQMTGENAQSNMNLDFTNVWMTTEDDYPQHQWKEQE